MAFDAGLAAPGTSAQAVYLTRGLVALIDPVDCALVYGRSWRAHQARSNVYARSSRDEYLHRLITGAQPGWVVDHLNGDSLDCRRNNLRVCGFDVNAQNAEYANSTGFRGVTLERGRFRARIRLDGATKHLGLFDSPEEAAQAYDRAALEFFGPFAWTNFQRDLSTVSASEDVYDIPF